MTTLNNEKLQEVYAEVNYDELIPNNVDLSSDRRLKKALEAWHPGYIDWWMDMGPEGFQEAEVYLRTAVGVDPKGWAKFGYVNMPEYRWGILLAPQEEGRTIPFGKHKGEPVWQEVPGEYRSLLRRLIVIQGDTEPASVEQQRHLGKTAPSLYDMRNLFQVNVEEGRHLWAMVYLLQKYFGKDGREEAENLLKRRSGDDDTPRMLGAFNEETPDWLSFFMFTYFTDRDGKMQLESLAQSGFDPLSRTCRFMLTEEAHHMFVGESGISRVIERTCEAMKEAGITDPADVEAVRKLGVIDLPMLQRKINFHFSVTLDLFGNEISTNAAAAFEAGIKGRYHETKMDDDHQLHGQTYPVLKVVNGKLEMVEETALNAINARLRDDYVKDASGGVKRWNKLIQKSGFDYELTLPHIAFNRQIGEFSDIVVSPSGDVITTDHFKANQETWLPSENDINYLHSLMVPVTETGEYASWIAAPKVGIDSKPGDFEYVKLED
ncbi:benzoyl-CoA 2,3-epoxidase subunit BoxB [Saccharospirillum sp.]|uniref:benzoyl-CoA 2,3-epoxidase subunit BoxB n=1 Tax=Saccharospirillum sp. TaxID=2033801 RepID=UPI0034A04B3F